MEWVNARSLGHKPKGITISPVDKVVSDIVGKTVHKTDPRLLDWAIEQKRKNRNEESLDNMLEREENKQELRRLFQ